MINIRKLEAELWESADLLRAGSDFPALRLQPLQNGGGKLLLYVFLIYAMSRSGSISAKMRYRLMSPRIRAITIAPFVFVGLLLGSGSCQ